MREFKPLEVESFLGKYIKSGLAFDMSKTSTGVSIYRDGKVTSFALQFDADDEEFTYATGLRMQELEESLLSVLDGDTHFDIIAVEEAILGVNAKVTSVAYALNYFIDYLIATGKLTCDKFVRINNKTWKRIIKSVTGTQSIKIGQDKEKKEIIEAFRRLNYPLASKHLTFKSWSAYMKSGYQDMLDSVGVLFGAVYYINVEGQSNNRIVRKSMKIVDSLEKAMKVSKFPVIDCPVQPSQLTTWYKGLTQVAKESTTFICKVPTLGRFGVEQGYLKLHDEYYIVVNVSVKIAK